MLKLKVKMVIMSHLSDVQNCLPIMSVLNIEDNQKRMNFVKYLLLKYPNTDVEIDAEKEGEEFSFVAEKMELKRRLDKESDLSNFFDDLLEFHKKEREDKN